MWPLHYVPGSHGTPVLDYREENGMYVTVATEMWHNMDDELSGGIIKQDERNKTSQYRL